MSEMHEEQEEPQVNITFDDDAPEEEVVEPETAEEAEAEPEKAEEPEGKLEFDEKQQQFINAKIGELTKREREALEKAEAIEQENAALKEKLGTDQRPEVPPIPDPYSPNFEQEIQNREAAVRAQAEWDAKQSDISERKLQQQQQADYAAQQKAFETQQAYDQRAQKLNIAPQDLAQAGMTIHQVGIRPDITEHILSDPLGPQITVHLAKHLAEVGDLNQMAPGQAAIYIENVIKPAATKTQKKVDPPPAPTDHLTGRGEPERQRGPTGAKFE